MKVIALEDRRWRCYSHAIRHSRLRAVLNAMLELDRRRWLNRMMLFY
jgi:uncharacterized membrane protein